MKRKISYFIDNVEVDENKYNEIINNESFLGVATIKFEEEETIESLKKIIEKLQLEIEELKMDNWREWDKYIKKDPNPFIFPTPPFTPTIVYNT